MNNLPQPARLRLDGSYVFLIRISGEANESDINLLAPREVTVTQSSRDGSILLVHTDQSGLLGILSYLHGLGFSIQSVYRLAQA